MRDPRTVLITGATGGIGSALALAYARPGRLLLLQGRDAERLASLRAACEGAGARIETMQLDLRDRSALDGWLRQLAGRGLPDLAVLCAGATTASGPQGEPEPWEEVEALLELNVRATMFAAVSLAAGMRQRGAGQIALVSSIAAYYGLPLTPAYSASKAALKTYGEALRGLLAPHGVEVSVVLPGFVRTAMTSRYPGPAPLAVSPEDAAARIVRGLARGRARIRFPFLLGLGMWALSVLPAPLAQRILLRLGYGARGE